MFSPDIEDPNDRVEVAFRRLDSDGDGYLDIEDFYQVRMMITLQIMEDDLHRLDGLW